MPALAETPSAGGAASVTLAVRWQAPAQTTSDYRARLSSTSLTAPGSIATGADTTW